MASSTPDSTPTLTQVAPVTATLVATPTAWLQPPAGAPPALIEEGLRLQAQGDYAAAGEMFRQALAEAETDDHRRMAAYHLGEAYVQQGDYLNADAAWEAFLTHYPDDVRRPAGTFLLAESLMQLGDCPSAVEAYTAYLAQETILGDLANEGIGDCMANSQRIPAAITAYDSALSFAPDASTEVGLREKMAGLYLGEEQYDQALAQYDAILDVAKIPDYRARILFQAGQAHLAAGEMEAAMARFRDALDNYPEEEFGYLSLVQLLEADQSVDELVRGKVDYYAGDVYPEAYEAALRALERVLQEPPSERVEEARYFMALTYRDLDSLEQASQAWETFIARHPASDRTPRAYLELSRVDERLERPKRALATLRTLITRFPEHDLAVEALWRIGTAQEQRGDMEAAAATYQELQQRFPGSDRAAAALFRSGLAAYRQTRLAEAAQAWNDLLEGYPQAGLDAQTLFWLYRAAAEQGDAAAATGYRDRLISGWPGHFYGLHAAELKANGPPSVAQFDLTPIMIEGKEADWEELWSWLTQWAEVPPEEDIHLLSAQLQVDSSWQRATRLLSVLRPLEARYWLHEVRTTWKDDPVVLAQLVPAFQQLGLPSEAARAGYRLWQLSPTESLRDLPVTLQKTLYPLAFIPVLNDAAVANELDPLLLAALVRQESYFDPIATSSAGARGLAQVMPATGEGIARSLNWPDFALDHLYRPRVSLTFGAWYLRVQLNRFDGDVWLALAAYNGGPGNALRWQELSGGDREMFVEVITASQSRIYVQRVYEQWAVYKRLYRQNTP